MEGLYKFGRAQSGDGCRNCKHGVHFNIVNGVAIVQLFANSFDIGQVAFVFQPKLHKANAQEK